MAGCTVGNHAVCFIKVHSLWTTLTQNAGLGAYVHTYTPTVQYVVTHGRTGTVGKCSESQ